MSYILPYTPGKLGNSEAEGKSGGTHRGGQGFFTRGLSDQSATTVTAQRCKEEELLFGRVLDFAMQLVVELVSGLNVGVAQGWYRKADGTDVEFAGQSSFAVDDDAIRYLYLLHSTGSVVKAAGLPADKTTFTPLAKVTAVSGAITDITDLRTLVMMQTQASSTSPTGTTGTAFTLDSDNVGVGVDQQVRFNRGSTDTEDAALEWDEANDRINTLKQHSAGTLCPLNTEKVQVSGTDALTSDGATKVQAAVAGDGLSHSSGVLAVNPDGSTLEIDSDQLRVKAGGVDTSHLSDAIADKLPQVSIGDASGASPRDVTIQVLDRQGNNLAEVIYLEVGAYDDADGVTEASNATIAVQTGTDLSSGNNKVKRVKTNGSGQAVIRVTDGTSETVYLLAGPTRRSRAMDCADIGTVVIS